MAKLRHIAIAAEDPFATAEFYKEAFEFKEVRRLEPGEPGKTYGVFLSDGTLNMAILKFKTDQLGKGMDFRGIHHFGVLVEDVEEDGQRLRGHDALAVATASRRRGRGTPARRYGTRRRKCGSARDARSGARTRRRSPDRHPHMRWRSSA